MNIVCIGAALVDEIYRCKEKALEGTSNPAVLSRSAGGVMRNIAHHLALLEVPVSLITALGNDSDGQWLKQQCEEAGIDMSASIITESNTGKYSAILNPDGSLYGAACMNPAEEIMTDVLLSKRADRLAAADMIIADTNLASTSLQWLISFCREKNIQLIIEPVSVSKARRLSNIDLSGVFMITPNEDELLSLLTPFNYIQEQAVNTLMQKGLKSLWLRKGAKGSAIYQPEQIISLPAPAVTVLDITGAGDAALAAWVAGSYYGWNDLLCLKAAHAMAAIVLEQQGAVAAHINKKSLENAINKYYPND
jgi:pseudouridine kinase